jgi:hypothetical protein
MVQFTQTRHATNPMVVGMAVQGWIGIAADRESVLFDEADIALEEILRHHGVLHSADVVDAFDIGACDATIRICLNGGDIWLEINVDGDVAPIP